MVAPAENHSATLLIVDDDAAARDRLREIFETAQYRVVTATEASSALRVLKGVRCDLVAGHGPVGSNAREARKVSEGSGTIVPAPTITSPSYSTAACPEATP